MEPLACNLGHQRLITYLVTSCPSLHINLDLGLSSSILIRSFNECSVNTAVCASYTAMSMIDAIRASLWRFLVQLFSGVIVTDLGIIAPYRWQGYITITDLYHLSLSWSLSCIWSIIAKFYCHGNHSNTTIFLYISIYLCIFYPGEITFSLPKQKGRWYRQIFYYFHSFIIMDTEMESREGQRLAHGG